MRLVAVALLATLIFGAALLALWLGQDANWDLRNYHFYNAWAFLNGRTFGPDMAAAQLQTFHNPTADFPFYLMIAAGIDPRAIAIALALPAAVASFFVVLIAWLMFSDLTASDRVGATTAATVIGLTPALPISQVATTFNEWPGTAMNMAALWLLLRAAMQSPRSPLAARALCVAGLLSGLAVGLKLTAGPYAVAFCVALIARPDWSSRYLRDGIVFGIFVLIGIAIAHGWWSWQLWSHYENPLFPYGNQYFHSPWWGERPVVTRADGPHTVESWLLFPFHLTSPRVGLVTEVPYRDARMAVLYGLGLVTLLGMLVSRWHRSDAGYTVDTRPAGLRSAAQFLSIFVAVSFVLWTAIYSALRYLITVEIVAGVLIVLLVGHIMRRPYAYAAIAISAIALVGTTRYPSWDRVPFGRHWFEVDVPAVEPNSLILLTANAPLSYLLPFFPADARHVGVRNNLNHPREDNLLQREITRVIAEHTGPMYALAPPSDRGEAELASLGIRIRSATCADVHSNLTKDPVQLCRLERE